MIKMQIRLSCTHMTIIIVLSSFIVIIQYFPCCWSIWKLTSSCLFFFHSFLLLIPSFPLILPFFVPWHFLNFLLCTNLIQTAGRSVKFLWATIDENWIFYNNQSFGAKFCIVSFVFYLTLWIYFSYCSTWLWIPIWSNQRN